MAVLEVTTLRLTAPEAEFIAADARLQQDFAYQQRGLVRRTTARGAARWVVVTLWQQAADADRAAAAARDDRVAAAWSAMVADVEAARYELLE